MAYGMLYSLEQYANHLPTMTGLQVPLKILDTEIERALPPLPCYPEIQTVPSAARREFLCAFSQRCT